MLAPLEYPVRLHAAGVNPVDWKIHAGWMKDFRPMTFPYVPGVDLAGVVAKVRRKWRDRVASRFRTSVSERLMRTYLQGKHS